MQFKRVILFASLLLLTALAVVPAFAQDELPDAEIQDDEGGVVFVTGQLAYTNPTLPDFGTQPIVFLGDMSELFGGEFVFSTEYINLDSPQFLATITSPITESPFTFELRLPIDPGGVLADVDNDGESDTGVSLYNLNFTFNGVGDPFVDNFDEEVYAGTSAFYFPDRGVFEINPLYETTIEPAPNEADRYRGPIAVLISPACFSNCEFFTYALTLRDDVAVVGYYPTGGLGGSIQQFAMPDGVFGQFTVGRALGADNEIHIQGTGIEPTLVVPVTEDTVFSEGDPLLDAAVEWLDEQP